jgi:hypothetical protein
MDQANSYLQSTPLLGLSTPTCTRRNPLHISRKTSWGTPIPPPSSQKPPTNESKDNLFDEVDLGSKSEAPEESDRGEGWNTLDNIAALGLSFNADAKSQVGGTIRLERFSMDDIERFGKMSSPSLSLEYQPFNKWMKNLQRRATGRRKTVSCDLNGSALERELFDSPSLQRRSAHKKSSSGSSSGFVTAVKSASVSLASISIAPRSRRTGVSSRHQKADRSSKASNVGRLSEDSSYIARGIVIDQAVGNRLLQRRRILEEIISTEESYVADVKFLMNVCFQNPSKFFSNPADQI